MLVVETGTGSATPLIGTHIAAAKSFAEVEAFAKRMLAISDISELQEFFDHPLATADVSPDALNVLGLCLLCPRFQPEGALFVREQILPHLQASKERDAHLDVLICDLRNTLKMAEGDADQRKHLCERLQYMQKQLKIVLLPIEEAEQLSPTAPWPEAAQAGIKTEAGHVARLAGGRTPTQLWLEQLEAAANAKDTATGAAMVK